MSKRDYYLLSSEDSEDPDEFDNKQVKKQSIMCKTLKDVKLLLTSSSMATTMPNPFEFTRQQRNNRFRPPEVMHFRPMNPNHQKPSKARQQKIDRLTDAAEQLSNLYKRLEIDEEQFMECLNDCLGYRPLQVYKAWCKILGNVKTRFEDSNNAFAKASDERMAIIQRKFEPTFCRPGAAPATTTTARRNAQRTDVSQLYANLQKEPRIEFRRPGEPANEAANVREVHIDTTQPDGQVIETEVLPGNEEIQNVVKRKRKRGGTKFIPKRQKKKAANLSTEKRSSTQPPTADRAPRTRNNNTSASHQPVETHPPRSRTTAASQQASSQPAAVLSSPLNYLSAPRQRPQTPDYEEREEEEKEGNYHLRPRQSVRQRGKQAAADERLQKRLLQTNAPVTPTRPRQPQGQQPTSERRYDSVEEDFSEVQLNVPAASNRRGNCFQRIASKNALNRRRQALENQLSISSPNPPQNQRVDDNPPHQRRGPKRQLIQHQQQQEQQVNEERGNQQVITTEYPIQDEQLHDDFQHVIPQEYPHQIEQPSAAATPQLQQPPVYSFQVESPASPLHPPKFNFKFLKLPSYLQTLFNRKIHFNNNNQILMQLQKFKNVFKMFFNLCRKMSLQILLHNFQLKFVILKDFMDFWNNLTKINKKCMKLFV